MLQTKKSSFKDESNVRRHVQNAFKEGELERDENNVHFLHVNGVKKPVPFYSLDVIIFVGYRVKSIHDQLSKLKILTIKMTLNEVLRTLRSLNEDNEITIFSIIGRKT